MKAQTGRLAIFGLLIAGVLLAVWGFVIDNGYTDIMVWAGFWALVYGLALLYAMGSAPSSR